MAGHSHSKNIMHRKGAQDQRRAREFAKVIREITVAAKTGLPEPNSNPRLRAAVSAARAINMPKDTVDRAIRKATEAGGGDDYVAVRYEGRGPAGVAVIVETLTDNRNRTASDIRSAFSKHGGALGETNSVSFMFARIGAIRYAAEAATEDAMLEAAIEAGADEAASGDDGHEITCAPEQFFAVRDALDRRFGPPAHAAVEWRAGTAVSLDADAAASMLKLIDALDASDDVQDVYSNHELSPAVAAQLDAA
jgi:YebC/PmpR family DNA-binding regulatory protein